MISKTLIDYREKKSRQKKALKILEPAEVVRLEAGDYVHQEVAVEFKTATDMIASIIDNRVFDECGRMAAKYRYPYLIIAGEVNKELQDRHRMGLPGRISVDSYLGVVARLSMLVNVNMVSNEDQALHLMQKIFEKIDNAGESYRFVPKPEHKTFNPAANYLSLIRGISTSKALKITEDLELETLTDLLGLDLEKLLSVDGIGKKTAISIMDKIKGER